MNFRSYLRYLISASVVNIFESKLRYFYSQNFPGGNRSYTNENIQYIKIRSGGPDSRNMSELHTRNGSVVLFVRGGGFGSCLAPVQVLVETETEPEGNYSTKIIEHDHHLTNDSILSVINLGIFAISDGFTYITSVKRKNIDRPRHVARKPALSTSAVSRLHFFLSKLSNQYNFKGYTFAVVKPLLTILSLNFGIKFPITGNFPVSTTKPKK